MVDWRGQTVKAQIRKEQITGQGSRDGLFSAYLEASTGESQSGTLVYAGGIRDIPLPMPYDGNTSWIRVIPDTGSPALAGYRADIQDTVFINYLNPNPKRKLDGYAAGTNLYRPLQPGEIEFNSTGMAQSYYSIRPILEQTAGVVREWLDHDKLESGAKAPFHTRQLWEYTSAPLVASFDATGTPILLGDEERFGVVRRPYNFNFDPTTLTPRSGSAVSAAAAAASSAAAGAANLALAAIPPNITLASQLTQLGLDLAAESALTFSFNYFDYPFPNFTTASGIINTTTLTTSQAVAASAAAVAALAVGNFEPRTFAKEYVRIIKNPLYHLAVSNPQLAISNPALVASTSSLLNPRLIDFREGQVFDDLGIQTLGAHGAYLRASYQYYTPAGDATSFTIDEVGNIDWKLSTIASVGWSVLIPTGGIVFTASSAITITSLLFDIDFIAPTGSISADCLQDINLTSGNETNFITGTNFSHLVTAGDYSVTIVAGNYSTKASMNIGFTAAADFSAQAATSMVLKAPLVNVGATPNQSMVLGDLLATWLNTLVSALEAAAPTGNLGAPVPLISDLNFSQTLTTLQGQITALKSATVKVSP
jgi:hypothetical protein